MSHVNLSVRRKKTTTKHPRAIGLVSALLLVVCTVVIYYATRDTLDGPWNLFIMLFVFLAVILLMGPFSRLLQREAPAEDGPKVATDEYPVHG